MSVATFTAPSYVVTDDEGNVVEGMKFTIWTAKTGGTQVTSLQDLDGDALPGYVTTDAKGRCWFADPAARDVLYVQPPGTPVPARWLVVSDQAQINVGQAIDRSNDAFTIATAAKTTADAAATTATGADGRSVEAIKVANEAKAIASSVQTVSVAAFGAVGDGIADDTPAIQAAIAAAPAGATVRLPAGLTFRTSAPIYNQDSQGAWKPVMIDATGATVLVDHTDTAVSVYSGGYINIRSATAIAEVDDVAVPDGAIPHAIQLTLSEAAPNWARGQLVFVSGSDPISGVMPQEGDLTKPARAGQYMTVISGGGTTTLTLAGSLTDPITTDVLVGEMRVMPFSWVGGTFELTDPAMAGADNAVIKIVNMLRPVIKNVVMPRVSFMGVYLLDSYGWQIDNLEAGYGTNNLGAGQNGYGVANKQSSFGVLSNSRFGQIRHGYTDGHAGIPDDRAATELGNHGRPFGCRIVNCVADSPSGSGFDTHTSSDHTLFEGCETINSTHAFGIRGRNVSIRDCRARDCGTGVYVFDQVTQDKTSGEYACSDTYGIVVDGFTANNCKDVIYATNREHGSGYPTYRVRDTRPSYARNVNATGITRMALRATFSTWHLSDWTVRFSDSGETYRSGWVAGALIYGRGLHFDYSSCTAGTYPVWQMSSDVSTLQIGGQLVTGNNGRNTYIVNNATASQVVRLADVVLDYPAGSPSANTVTGWLNWSAASQGGPS